jgi:hypothetical protein
MNYSQTPLLDQKGFEITPRTFMVLQARLGTHQSSAKNRPSALG